MSKKTIWIAFVTIVVGLLVLSLAACTGTQSVSAAGDGEHKGEGYGKGGGNSGEMEATPQGYAQGSGQGRGMGRGGGGGNLDGTQGNQQGSGQGNGQGYGKGQGAGGGGGALQAGSFEPLSEIEAEALMRAIQEEYGAQALYQSVLDTFGDVEPFSRIVGSEAQHAAALVRMAEKYGLPVPEFTSTEGLPEFETLAEACQAGVEAEIADAALYDELAPLTTHADILRVYENLKNASLNNHLPAFQACQ